MKIEKAIEILELNLEEAGASMPPDCKEAVQLSLEALKREQGCREDLPHEDWLLLPGETRE